MPWLDAEKRKAKNLSWNKANRERKQASDRAYHARHREEINAKKRERYEELHPPED